MTAPQPVQQAVLDIWTDRARHLLSRMTLRVVVWALDHATSRERDTVRDALEVEHRDMTIDSDEARSIAEDVLDRDGLHESDVEEIAQREARVIVDEALEDLQVEES